MLDPQNDSVLFGLNEHMFCPQESKLIFRTEITIKSISSTLLNCSHLQLVLGNIKYVVFMAKILSV